MKNERGVAMLLAIVAMLIMAFLAAQIASRSALEFEAGASSYDQLKAYHLAKIGVEMSRLKIYVYRMIQSKFGDKLQQNQADLDMIWQIPFKWPLSADMIPGVSLIQKDEIAEINKETLIDGIIDASTEGEGGKIDVNDLASPSENFRKATSQQLQKIIQDRLDADDDWARENRNRIKPEEIVNNIADWIDEDSEGQNGGSEESPYRNDIKPPNRSMKTLEELHMVAEVNDEIFKILAPRLTVYGIKGININLAGKEILKSLDLQMTDQVVQDVMKHRDNPDEGPFKDENSFLSFLQSKGVVLDNFNKKNPIPLLFDAEYNFRISSVGISRRAQRKIIAIVYDFAKVKTQLTKLTAASPTPTPAGGQAPQTGQPAPTPTPETNPPPSGPPAIVFWQEG